MIKRADVMVGYYYLLYILHFPLVAHGSLQVVGSMSSPRGSGEGLCFSDGRRKVDYVLVFHQRRHSSIRSPAGVSTLEGEAPSVGEVFVELGGNEPTEPADHEIHLIRQEFEANLLEAGLEIERDSGVSFFTRLHAPWQVLCREAEFLKIKVPTKTVRYQCKVFGFGSSMSKVWRKMNQPFQPKVPHQDHERTKFLSHCFSRDKLHLYNVTSKDTFFDNATRGRIVYEILRRTVCVQTCQTIGEVKQFIST
uniref:Anoctamin dimerisation domain-containing protein n=1 Tax=Mola mola TaxID=94237 RepID=A0A3Q3W9K3_MOLML